MATLLALVLLAAACAGEGDGGGGAGSGRDGAAAPAGGGSEAAPAATAELEGGITVFAAASLAEAFTEVDQAFTSRHDEVTVRANFDGSSMLVRQILSGAPADVFASADSENMDRLVEAGAHGGEPVTFATNRLVIIVAAGNPQGITGLADLADPDLTTVICAPEVPCGRYAERAFAAAGVEPSVDSLEQNVRGVVTKVIAGEADAGIAYATDIPPGSDDAGRVDLPDDLDLVVRYPLAVVEGSGNRQVAEAYVDFVTGPEGQAILARHGFGPPDEP